MLLSLRKNGLTSLFKEVGVLKAKNFTVPFCRHGHPNKYATFPSEKHRAREPRIWPTNSLTKVVTRMPTRVYTKMSTEMPTKAEAFSVQNAAEDPHEDSYESAHGKFSSAHGKMYTKVSSVNFHMSYFHMFCFLAIPRVGTWKPKISVLPFLAVLEFLVCLFFVSARVSLVFFWACPPFSKDFRGSVGIKKSLFFGGFPGFFEREKKKEGHVSTLLEAQKCHSRCSLASRFGICVADITFRRGNVSAFHSTSAQGPPQLGPTLKTVISLNQNARSKGM